MDGHVACAGLHFDPRGAEIGATRGDELRQQREGFGPRAQHRADQVMAGLRTGQHLANEQALMDFEAVLVSLHALALGGEFGLGRQDVRPARRGLPQQRVDTQRPGALLRQVAIHRDGMLAEKAPRGIGRQMDDRFAARLFLPGSAASAAAIVPAARGRCGLRHADRRQRGLRQRGHG